MLRRLFLRLLGRGREGPIEGTIADRLLQTDILMALQIAVRANAELKGDAPPDTDWRDCHVVKVDVLDEPALSDDGASVVGPWSERWIVELAGTAQAYTITFTPDEAGGMDFSIVPPDEGQS